MEQEINTNDHNSMLDLNNNNPAMLEVKNLIDDLEFEKAKILLEKLLKDDENNVEKIDCLSEVLLNLGDNENAIILIKKSISLEPNKNGDKYMTMGQYSKNSKAALKSYENGINVFLQELKNENDVNRIISLKDSIASAYATIAELYMNTDLCNEFNAEDICEKSLSEALKYNPESLDTLIQLSNLRILRKRDEEASICMEKIYTFVLTCLDQCNDQSLPSQDILMNLSKNFAEIGQYIKAIKLLDIIIKLNDEDLECWYLLAFYHYSIKNFKHTAKCLKHFKRVSEKTNYKSESVLEFEDAARELELAIEKVRKSCTDGKLKNNNLEESEENDQEEKRINTCEDMNIDN